VTDSYGELATVSLGLTQLKREEEPGYITTSILILLDTKEFGYRYLFNNINVMLIITY
jgi:hypothetical protein